MRRQFLSSLLACLAVPAAALAQTKPTLWVQMNSGYTVDSASTTNCDILKMVYATPHLGISRSGSEQTQLDSAYSDGVATATTVCDAIHTSPPARLGIFFDHFGRGGGSYSGLESFWAASPTLMFHPDDQISGCSASPGPPGTPWPGHAQAECSAWMRGFWLTFRARQLADTTIPNPEHCAFDIEAYPGVGDYSYYGTGNTTTIWANFLVCLMADDRSGADSSKSKVWRFLPLKFGEHKTLAQLYKDAQVKYDDLSSPTTLPLDGSGNPDPATVLTTTDDHVRALFASWLNGIFYSVEAEVLDSAIRPYLTGFYPSCTYSNFYQAAADGGVVSSAPFLPPYVENSPFVERYRVTTGSTWYGTSGCRMVYDTFTGWNNMRMNNPASADSPALYDIADGSGFVDDSNYFTNYFAFWAAQLDAVNFSAQQTRRHRIIPWIAGRPNMQYYVYLNHGFSSSLIDNNFYRDLYALGRSRGVKDYLYFQDSTSMSSTAKGEIDTIMGDVWGASPVCATVNLGTVTSTGDEAVALAESDAVKVDVNAVTFSTTYKADYDVHFALKSGFSPSKLKIVVEAHATFNTGSASAPTDIVLSAWPYRVSDGYYGSGNPYAVLYGATATPGSMSVVVPSASSYFVTAASAGTCSKVQEFWVRITGQPAVSTPFTMHIDNVRVYGYE